MLSSYDSYAAAAKLNDSDSDVSLKETRSPVGAHTVDAPSLIHEESSVASSTSGLLELDGDDRMNKEAELILSGGIMEAEEQGLDALVHLLRGQKLLIDGEYEAAAGSLESSLDSFLQGECELDISVYVYTLLVDAYHGMAHYMRCCSVAKEWIKRYPACVTAHATLAHVLFEQGQFDDCIAACSVAISSIDECEGIMSVYNTRGHAYRKKGMWELSVKDYQQVKALGEKEGLVRFAVDKPPFLTCDAPVRTAHLTPHAERRLRINALVALVKQSRKGAPSPDCSPDKLKARHRGKERHFERQRSNQRLLTGRLGHFF